jgi:prephenate dehydrogenase
MDEQAGNGTHQVGVLGYGRFGRALCRLLLDAGFTVRAWDPHNAVDAALDAGTRQACVTGPRFVVLAVPVPAIRETLEAIRPFLTPRQIVADVGSVKVQPHDAMAEVLGSEIPWVATHPLFGPASLARGELPLRVVVCPSPNHPAAMRSVVRMLQRLECTVLQQDAHEHDRTMADTHALGFFLAKALVDAGATFESEAVPPSSQGIARLIRAVRADAGHLLDVLHRANPYAAEARRKVLQSLAQVHDALEQDAPLPAIPDLGTQSPALQEIRDHIDDVDAELLRLLSRRARLAERAGRAKRAIGAATKDPRREAELRADRREQAEALGLDPAGTDQVFGAILRASVAMQEARAAVSTGEWDTTE